MNKRRYILLASFLVIVGLTCETTNNEPEGLAFGKFEGLVGTSPSNGLYEELEGQAWFSLNESDSVFSFELFSGLISDTLQTRILLSIKSLELPREGIYSLMDVDTTSQILAGGFSGSYLSPSVGMNEKYYSESGSLTITKVEPENGIKGYFEGVFFKLSEVDSAQFVRQYSQINGTFYASSVSL